jgi:hypothetical protein
MIDMLLWLLLHGLLLSTLQGGMDLSPHLYVLPLDLTPFMEVLAALGAQEAFSAAQYTTVLQVCRGLCGSFIWRVTPLDAVLILCGDCYVLTAPFSHRLQGISFRAKA